MKTITSALQAHLAQTVTTMAVCWQIIRMDGASFAFTTLDADLVISGVTYKSIVGFSRTAIMTGSIGQVDNLEVLGYFDATNGIVEQDIENGLFDYAEVFLFAVNWTDLTQGILKLRRGWLGETVRLPNGVFRAELRGLTQALVQEFNNVVSPVCRADLGDSLCRVPLLPPAWQPDTAYTAVVYSTGSYVAPLTKPTLALKQAIFQCTTSGTSGATEPAWNTTGGATTADGSAVWTAAAPLRLIGTVTAPVSQHQFVVQPLIYPAGQVGSIAVINVENNASADTALEISDGVHAAVSIIFPYATAGHLVVTTILAAMAAATTDIVTVQTQSLQITFTNTSGAQGNITKIGDIALPPALNISNFAPGYLDGGTITWITGLNAGRSIEMKTYDTDTTSVVLWLGAYFTIQAGDTFWYYPGCDKRRETCHQKFANMLNFRGEPDVPGLDMMLAYPEAG